MKSSRRSPAVLGLLLAARGRFEKLAGVSTVPVRAAVDAPTAIADETHAGKLIAVKSVPLPLDMIVATPTDRNLSIDILMGSALQAVNVP